MNTPHLKVMAIKCAGLDQASNHPLIYLKLKDGSAQCPYCGVKYYQKSLHLSAPAAKEDKSPFR